MNIRLYNSLSKKIEKFIPENPDNIRMYVCGPTVYDDIHIGNARPIVVFDILFRLLRKSYKKVTYVRNITDVDDKINARAIEENRTINELTTETIRNFQSVVKLLGTLPPNVEPKATDHINGMIKLTKRLIENGYAYVSHSHVLFNVDSAKNYGQLSGRNISEMMAGARIEIAPYKNNPYDFVLWKPSINNEPGWNSPWGYGRPGWHIECSVMSRDYLGKNFDIHGGGLDLLFPHHENEMIQSISAYPDETFARYWLHNGYLMSEGEKMSKSKGNFYKLCDLLSHYSGEVIKFVLINTHYRQPIDFTNDNLVFGKKILDKWYRLIGNEKYDCDIPNTILDALCNDLNTPLVISEMHSLANSGKVDELYSVGKFLGFFNESYSSWFRLKNNLDTDHIESLINKRKKARLDGDFKSADKIRMQLQSEGIALEDIGSDTKWRKI